MLKLTLSILLLFLVDVGLDPSLQATDRRQASEPLEILVNVSNNRGTPIRGLKQENFQIFIDKIEQKIDRLSEADEPCSIGIVVDASGSIQDSAKMQDLAQAILRFHALSNKQNEYFVLAFNITPELLMDWGTNLEPGLANLITVKPQRHTAFYDAFYVAAEKVNRGRHRKRALIVISDGMDNQSRYSFKEVREHLKETDVILYVIGLGIPGTAGSALGIEARALVNELTELSGGISIFRRDDRPWQTDELKQAVELIAGSLRHQYRIRLTPTYKPKEKWHRLKIKMNAIDSRKELKGLSARAREGFYLMPGQTKE